MLSEVIFVEASIDRFDMTHQNNNLSFEKDLSIKTRVTSFYHANVKDGNFVYEDVEEELIDYPQVIDFFQN
jgi:hypothetical protein